LVHQFYATKAGADVALDEAEEQLRTLSEGIDFEELLAKGMQDEGEDDDRRTEDEMLAEECADLDASMWPVWLLLVKVGSLVLYNGVNLNGKDKTALEDCIQNNPLDHHYITVVVLLWNGQNICKWVQDILTNSKLNWCLQKYSTIF
jgi:hypothetical protein